MKSARSKVRVETREKIISDCALLMMEKGYFSVSVPELEKASGRTKAVLYGYFMNKNELAMAVLDHNLEQQRNEVNDLVKLSVTNRDKLMAHILFYYPKTTYALAGNGCQLFTAAAEACNTYKEMREKVAKALLSWEQDIIKIIQDGIKQKEFKAEASINETAWQIIALIESAVLVSKTMQSRKPGIQLLDQAKCLVANL
jgi:AcrR family transcriptional regulator